MFNIVLYEPEIAPNTGNIIRLCANTGCVLHLIEPLGFEPTDKKLRRAGLDYHDWAKIILHANFAAFQEFVRNTPDASRVLTYSTHSETLYTDIQYQKSDYLLFGPETRGLPADVRNSVPDDHQLTLPMMPNNRSLNLSNSASIVAYEAWRQCGFQQ